MQPSMIRDANVIATSSFLSNGQPIATINVNDTHQHTFDPSSRISKALTIMSTDELSEQLSHGNFFFIDSHLVDFRHGQYNGFVHTDNAIDKLFDTIGITDTTESNVNRTISKNNTFSQFKLETKWSDHAITIPQHGKGGKFNSELHYTWNPFVKTVNSVFMLYRLICSNGMMGMRSFVNSKIPLVNRWEEHLNIANTQTQHIINSKITTRISQMSSERATLAETIQLTNHAQIRLTHENNQHSNHKIQNIINIASPQNHLTEFYTENAFSNMNAAKQLPAHLSVFDLYNMITELRSHTNDNTNSTTHALDKLANILMFDRSPNSFNTTANHTPPLNPFSNPEQAFFGIPNYET